MESIAPVVATRQHHTRKTMKDVLLDRNFEKDDREAQNKGFRQLELPNAEIAAAGVSAKTWEASSFHGFIPSQPPR